jgi:hypothetical protein
VIVKQSISTYSATKFKKIFISEKVVRIFTTRLEKVNDFALRDFIIILVLWIHVFVYVHRISFIQTWLFLSHHSSCNCLLIKKEYFIIWKKYSSNKFWRWIWFLLSPFKYIYLFTNFSCLFENLRKCWKIRNIIFIDPSLHTILRPNHEIRLEFS